jgi:hypothetical protein
MMNVFIFMISVFDQELNRLNATTKLNYFYFKIRAACGDVGLGAGCPLAGLKLKRSKRP